jgi:hypothetical protein
MGQTTGEGGETSHGGHGGHGGWDGAGSCQRRFGWRVWAVREGEKRAARIDGCKERCRIREFREWFLRSRTAIRTPEKWYLQCILA